MIRSGILVLATLLLFSFAHAGTHLKGSIGQLPVLAENNEKGMLIGFLKAMQKAYPEGKITFEVMPFKRSMQEVLSGKSDFHAPILKDPGKTEKELGFAFSDANVWDVIFAIYTPKNKIVDIRNLQGLNIETEAAHTAFFDFPVKPSTCIDCSLKKVDAGRIDGFIFAAMECDEIVKKLGLKNIKSAAFRTYEGKFVLPLGEKGKKTNAVLTEIFNRTKKNGDYAKTLGPIVEYYKNWKPMP